MQFSNLHYHSLIRLHENNPFLVFLLCSKILHFFVWFCFLVLAFFFSLHEWWQESEAFKLQTTVQMHLLFIQVQTQACCQNEKVISASLHTKNLDYSEYSNPNRILENNVLNSSASHSSCLISKQCKMASCAQVRRCNLVLSWDQYQVTETM